MSGQQNRRTDHNWGGERRKPIKLVFGSLVIIIIFIAAFAGGYGLTALLYMRTGAPPEPWRTIISGIVGMLLLAGVSTLYTKTMGRKHFESHGYAINDALAAMRQIAQGNFDVALDPGSDDRLAELTGVINEMAQNLGSLETMRQDFVSNVSHEIQSPLTSIGGFAALLKNDALPANERRRYAEIIEAESKRISSLSDNLLKLSTLDGNKAPLTKLDFRLDKQLERIALTLEPQWTAKNLAVEADLQKCTLFGDEDLLSQVWMNLLHNAIKFTPGGGKIDILLQAEEGSALVKIADTGVGIAPDDQIHIFERFYKVDKARDRSLGGNGLGLSLVKRIVELHGGNVSIDSELGKGTIFSVALPQQ